METNIHWALGSRNLPEGALGYLDLHQGQARWSFAANFWVTGFREQERLARSISWARTHEQPNKVSGNNYKYIRLRLCKQWTTKPAWEINDNIYKQ